MKGFELDKKELETLRLAHKSERDKKLAYRINAIILLGSSWTIENTKTALLLDDETLRGYVKKYREGGIEGLCEKKHKGSSPKLDDAQALILEKELDLNIYLTTKSVIAYVNKKFNVNYSQSGMKTLLHRLNYEYKKPKLVPGNPDEEEQEIFAEQYEEFMLNKPSNAEVLFMDAVHPEHNAMAAYGWIKRGENRPLKTNSGRERLNLHGVINAETHEVTILESETIDGESTIQLLEMVRQKYFLASMIYIILDNARYHYSKKVKEYLSGKKIKLVFLPSYSPNLNLIERLWRFFKKNVLYNKYYENIDSFRKGCIKFFKNIDEHKEDIKKFMDADFELAW